MTNIRSVMGAMDLDQVLSHRDEINERLLRVVDAAASPWGLKVTRIEIKDIVPPRRPRRGDGPADEGRARQARRHPAGRGPAPVGNPARGRREAGQILQAEGRREAAFRDAEARERSAEAEAKATQMVSKAIAKGDVAAMNYFIAQKYIKAFGQAGSIAEPEDHHAADRGGGVLGSLAGIGEIAKATFGESAASAAAAARRASVPPAGSTPPVPPQS